MMGTYDTRGGTPRHDKDFDYDYPCEVCGLDPYDCECLEECLQDSLQATQRPILAGNPEKETRGMSEVDEINRHVEGKAEAFVRDKNTIEPLRRTYDNTIYGFRCKVCDYFWKVYQKPCKHHSWS
jgi:hypothetical protein